LCVLWWMSKAETLGLSLVYTVSRRQTLVLEDISLMKVDSKSDRQKYVETRRQMDQSWVEIVLWSRVQSQLFQVVSFIIVSHSFLLIAVSALVV